MAIPDLFGSNVPGTRSVFGKWKSDPALFIFVDAGFPCVFDIIHMGFYCKYDGGIENVICLASSGMKGGKYPHIEGASLFEAWV